MRKTLPLMACLLAVALASCSAPKSEKGDKGDPGPKGDTGPAGPPGPTGKDGADGKLALPMFRVVRGTGGGVAQCGTDEQLVSAVCLSDGNRSAVTPTTAGDREATCDAGNSPIPMTVVILCAKR